MYTCEEISPGSKPLENVKHERFARLVARGKKTLVHAYRESGYRSTKSNYSAACKLKKHPAVHARIEYLASLTGKIVRAEKDLLEEFLRDGRSDMTRENYELQLLASLLRHRVAGNHREETKVLELLGRFKGYIVDVPGAPINKPRKTTSPSDVRPETRQWADDNLSTADDVIETPVLERLDKALCT